MSIIIKWHIQLQLITDEVEYFIRRPCVVADPDNRTQVAAEISEDLSKCGIKETEKPQAYKNGAIPSTKTTQVYQNSHGRQINTWVS